MAHRACGLLLLACLRSSARPNIVVFLTDDQDVEGGSSSREVLPQTYRALVDTGTSFSRMYAAVPVCCPSRSALFSGRYSHNNGCVGNGFPSNCSSPSWQAEQEPHNWPVHLQTAGYATSFGGKYLNLYGLPKAGGVAHVPPGWSNWQGLVGNSIYYGYSLSNNGIEEKHGHVYELDYLPNVVLNKTLAFLASHRAGPAAGSPYLAMLSLPACHGPADPAPPYADSWAGSTAPRTPAYNVSSTGMHWLQQQRGFYPFDNNTANFVDLVHRRRLATLKTVDDIVASVVADVTAAGELDHTLFIYTSDNGYHLGQYGFLYDKRQPWETDTHLPLFVSGPGFDAGAVSNRIVSMVDIGPTILDAAGLPVPPTMDGASFLRPASPTRRMALVEYHGETGDGGGDEVACKLTTGSDLFGNPDGPYYEVPPFFNGTAVCVIQDSANNTYNCLRIFDPTGSGSNARYCEFQELTEYVDYTQDPYELVNAVAQLTPAVKAAMHDRLAAAVACAGSAACDALLTLPI